MMDRSLLNDHVKLIDDVDKIVETQKRNGLKEIDHKKYIGQIGHKYGIQGFAVKVQFYIDKIYTNIVVHPSLIVEAIHSTLPSAYKNNDFSDVLPKSIQSATNLQDSTMPIKRNSSRKFINIDREVKLKDIFEAILDKTITDIAPICKDNPHIHDRDDKGQNALHCASYIGNTKKMETLIENEIDVMAIDSDGDTSLHLAIFGKHYEAAEYLGQNHPALLRIKNFRNETPLLLAAKLDIDKIFRKLFEYDSRILDHQDKRGYAAIHYIAWKDNCELLKTVLAHTNIRLHLLNGEGFSAFHIACYHGNKRIIDVFHNYSKKMKLSFMSQFSSNNESGIHLSLRKQHYDLTRHLIKILPRRWSRDPINLMHGSLLHYAVNEAQLDIVKDIIAIDPAIVDIKDQHRRSPLDLALEKYQRSSPENHIKSRDIARYLYVNKSVYVLPRNQDTLNRLITTFS